jgi:hypothetical protein
MLKVTAKAAIRAIVRAPKGVLLYVGASTLALLGSSCAAEAPTSTVSGGTGGTAGSAGASAGTAGASAGAAGATGGAAGTAGAGGGGAGTPPACDFAGIIQNSCAKTACHDTMYNQAGIDFRTPGYEQRLVNMPATFTDITCPDPAGGLLPVPCVPPSCPQGALLINTTAPAESWMLKKLLGTHADCGDAMPLPPGMATPDEKACLESWIHYLAGG